MYAQVECLQCGYWGLASCFLLRWSWVRIPTDEPLVFSPQTECKCWVPCIQSLGGSGETMQCPVHKALHRISSRGWFSLFSALKSFILLSCWLWNNDMGTLRFPQRNSLSKIGLYLPGVPLFALSQSWEYSISVLQTPAWSHPCIWLWFWVFPKEFWQCIMALCKYWIYSRECGSCDTWSLWDLMSSSNRAC